MTDVEHLLLELAEEVDWPSTPEPAFRLPARRRRELRRAALAGVVLALVALVVALAVPGARSAILRLFRIGGARVERVRSLPAAPEPPLAATLGRPISRTAAREALGAPVRLPAGQRQLHISTSGIVSVIVRSPDGPVLASELRSLPAVVLVKKMTTAATRVEAAPIRAGSTGFWLSGRPHVLLEPAPARLAGNVLLWDVGPVTYRLEGRRLRLSTALALARRMEP